MEKKFLVEKELATRWSVTQKKLQNDRTARRGIRFHKLDGSVRYAIKDIEEYESDCLVQTITGKMVIVDDVQTFEQHKNDLTEDQLEEIKLWLEKRSVEERSLITVPVDKLP